MALLRVYVTAWYRDLRRRTLAAEVLDTGFDGVELSLDYPVCVGVSVRDLAQVRELASSGLGLGVHLPWREVFLASPLVDVRRASTGYVLRCLDDASVLEPKYAVVHVSSDQAYCMDNAVECVRVAEESISAIARACWDLGIPLHVETTRGYCCGGLEHMANYIAYGARVCLDIPHSVERYSKLYRRLLGLEDVVREAPPQVLEAVGVTHLHGYTVSGYRVVDSHLVPGKDLVVGYASMVRRGVLRPAYTVLESFYVEPGRHLEIANLRWVVEDLKLLRHQPSYR